jgi:multidrug transporter EmrE-like cation transporter
MRQRGEQRLLERHLLENVMDIASCTILGSLSAHCLSAATSSLHLASAFAIWALLSCSAPIAPSM